MPSPLQDATVLIVEDDELVLRMVSKTMGWAGVGRVIEARNATEAWKLFQQHRPGIDLVVSDWNMPQVSGMDLLRRLRQTAPELPFVMLTGRGTLESALEAKQSGVSAFVAKPFSPQGLARKVNALLQARRQPRRREGAGP